MKFFVEIESDDFNEIKHSLTLLARELGVVDTPDFNYNGPVRLSGYIPAGFGSVIGNYRVEE